MGEKEYMDRISDTGKPFHIYAKYIEEGALKQFCEAMEHPSITRGSLMPDVHQGYTLPIGAVVETDGMVFPSYVGYDIGCGMCAIPTNFSKKDITFKAKKIFNQIRRDIPLGFNHHKVAVPEVHQLKPGSDIVDDVFEKKKGWLQLGTLGGGNHFIEIGYDEYDAIWIIIHSGSRGVGHGCAHAYMSLASPTGKASEGHYGFSVDSDIGKQYINDLNWCLDFALLNRRVMISIIIDAIRHCGLEGGGHWNSIINRNHNHAESKDGRYWIHRKGATHAEKDMMGVIPGNMRDGSFIVRGLGNEESLYSSSHGAGRVLGRKKAKQTLNVNDFADTMEGIVASVSGKTLDESPFAYKNIFEVMELQKGLVEVITSVKPIINVKG